MKTNDIRRKFIQFFESKQHTYVPSASTIPVADQTILFTIAGMTQFKSCLTGEELRPYKRATNAQKCIRVADLDDVGKDGRHCTMFEMLGSWSFGDYYKKDAVAWAYEFVRDELKLDLKRLWVTVHTNDTDAIELWKLVGIPENRIVALGDKDNFWAMGPTGPCGPCTEMYFDQGPSVGRCDDKNFDCKKGPGCDCDRYLEFWNLVFMQYNRQKDTSLVDLPMKSVDTGMGLERVAALMQGKTSNFDIDLFHKIKTRILNIVEIHKHPEELTEQEKESCNVVADHVRLLTFTIADGANFSNEGRGYVLRRVLRRAVRHAHKLAPNWNKHKSLLAKIIPTIIKEMQEFYPEISQNEKRIIDAVTAEELRFSISLESGLSKFNQFIVEAKAKQLKVLSGEQVFILHDSFGFPFDLTRVLCEEINFKTDLDGFAKYMQEQKERSRSESKFYKFDHDESVWIDLHPANQFDDKNFTGYQLIATQTKHNVEIAEIKLPADSLKKVRQLKNKCFELSIAHSPFYPEGGGQVADQGWFISSCAQEIQEFEVINVRKTPVSTILLLKHAEFSEVDAEIITPVWLNKVFGPQNIFLALVNMNTRLANARHHTATHLMHKALQIVLGSNVRQAGSLITPKTLRFDFTHPKGMTNAEIEKIERIVNTEILKNNLIHTHKDVPIQEAKARSAMAMFDEKYEDHVRMVEISNFSLELCGGTHVTQTGEIGLFKIISEASVTSGVRRIEAIAGIESLNYFTQLKKHMAILAETAKCAENDLEHKIIALREQSKDLEKNIQDLQSRFINTQIDTLLSNAFYLAKDLRLVSYTAQTNDLKEIELLCDRLKEKTNTIAVIFSIQEDKVIIMAAVYPALTKQFKSLSAGNIVKELSGLLNGKGGGRPDFARGGGIGANKVPMLIQKTKEIIEKSIL